MGLISDRKNKKREQFQNSVNVVGGNSTSGSLGSFHPSAFHHHHGGGGGPGHPPPHLGVIPTQHRMSSGLIGKGKKGVFGPQVLPAPQGTPHGLHPQHHNHHHPQLGGFGGGGGIQSRSGRGGSSTSLHHSHHHQPPPSLGPAGLQKYPAGYYTTPVHHTSGGGGGGSGNASWSHPSAGSGGGGGGAGVRSAGSQNQLHHAGNNPRYQTWVAPRKQPALSQLVSRLKDVIDGLRL